MIFLVWAVVLSGTGGLIVPLGFSGLFCFTFSLSGLVLCRHRQAVGAAISLHGLVVGLACCGKKFRVGRCRILSGW